jgi:hypothetical protein
MMDSAYAFAPTVRDLLHTMVEREPYIAALHYDGAKEIVEDNLHQMEDATIEFQDALKEKAPVSIVTGSYVRVEQYCPIFIVPII